MREPRSIGDATQIAGLFETQLGRPPVRATRSIVVVDSGENVVAYVGLLVPRLESADWRTQRGVVIAEDLITSPRVGPMARIDGIRLLAMTAWAFAENSGRRLVAQTQNARLAAFLVRELGFLAEEGYLLEKND